MKVASDPVPAVVGTAKNGAAGSLHFFAPIQAAALQWLEERLSPKTLFDSTETARADYYRSTLRDKRYPQYQTWREQWPKFKRLFGLIVRSSISYYIFSNSFLNFKAALGLSL